jgi:hypothetical protein
MGKRWTNKEIEKLIKLYPNNSVTQIAYLLDHPERSVSWKISKLNLSEKCKRWTEEEDKILIDNFPTTPARELAKILINRNINTIYARAEKLGVKKGNIWTTEDLEFLEENYTSLNHYNLVEKFPNRSTDAIQIKAGRVLRQKDKARKRIHKHSVNENFFSSISPISSYWAGFIGADGNIFGNSVKIELQIRDKHHLERFVSDTNFKGTVDDISRVFKSGIMAHRSTVNKVYTYSRLRVSSQQWVKDLNNNFNITEKKSLTLKPPDFDNYEKSIPYIIGYIDGDGCISLGAKKRNTTNSYWYLSVIGTHGVLSFIKITLDKLFPYSNNSKQASIIKKGKVYCYTVGGKRIVEAIEYLNQIDVPKLQRKWDIHKRYNEMMED